MTSLTSAQIQAAIALYRIEHPRSRAERKWTYVGSTGSVTRATCVFCRAAIATCSAKWRPTKAFGRAILEHECPALLGYATRAPGALAELATVAMARRELETAPAPELPIELDDRHATAELCGLQTTTDDRLEIEID